LLDVTRVCEPKGKFSKNILQNVESKILMLTSVDGIKARGTRFTADWNSSDHCVACRHVKRSEPSLLDVSFMFFVTF
jgi:hypothetical protein